MATKRKFMRRFSSRTVAMVSGHSYAGASRVRSRVDCARYTRVGVHTHVYVGKG